MICIDTNVMILIVMQRYNLKHSSIGFNYVVVISSHNNFKCIATFLNVKL
jgi:hypothetical protein